MKLLSSTQLQCPVLVLTGLLCIPTYGVTSAPFPPEPPLWSLLEDADQDGMKDIDEILLGMNPLDHSDGLSDEDGDGLSFAWEYYLGTNPSIADSDGDGWSDSEEVLLFNTDPLDATSFPKSGSRHAIANTLAAIAPSGSLIPAVAPSQPLPQIYNGDFTHITDPGPPPN